MGYVLLLFWGHRFPVKQDDDVDAVERQINGCFEQADLPIGERREEQGNRGDIHHDIANDDAPSDLDRTNDR